MIGFYLVAFTLVLLSIAVLIWPLYRHHQLANIDRRQQNIDIAREQLAELKSNQASGRLTQEEFEQQRNELEVTVLEDTLAEETTTSTQTTTRHGPQQIIAVLLIALLLPAAAGFLYLILGTPQAIDGVFVAQQQQSASSGKIQAMVTRLAAKMAKNPDDPKGWLFLARSYMVLKQYPAAVKALQHVRDLEGDKPQVLVSYANAVAMSRGGDLSGDVTDMLDKVLQQDPSNIEGLWLSGLAARQRGDLPAALKFWRLAIPLVTSDAQALSQLQGLIRQTQKDAEKAQSAAGTTPAATTTSNTRLIVNVSLSPELQNKTSPDNIVFIYARALQGNTALPLAIAQKKVSDLPLRIVLDDTMAMLPSAKLSKYLKVRLTARITLNGKANPSSGDLIGEVSPVDTNQTEPIEVVITQVVP